MLHRSITLLIVSTLLISTCSYLEGSKDFINISRKSIDEVFLQEIKSKSNLSNQFTITSYGGRPSIAGEVALLFLEKNISITINVECLSACAEFLLPSAQSLKFRDNPIIGFHWNPVMLHTLLERHANKDLQYCKKKGFSMQKNLYHITEHNIDFWELSLEKLELTNYIVDYKFEECPWSVKKFKNHMWLPTSQQLKNDLQLKFTGSVCADNFEKCTKKIDRRWKAGTRIVVGDEVYVSKGIN